MKCANQTKSLSGKLSKMIRLKLDLTKYQEEHYFRLDSVFDEKRTNSDVYAEAVKPIVGFALSGGKVSCFAYGQTGSGKTYTMIGDAKNPGLYLLSAQDIFDYLDSQPPTKTIAVSYFEIYCGKVFDLLNNREKLVVREDAKQNVNVVGLTRHQVLDVDGLFQKITHGNSIRMTSQTGKNNDSSRSHAILQIYFVEKNKINGMMSFIDLAGNERGEDTKDHEAQTRHDGAEISKSLLALKECIRALDQDKKHVPFRGSKLTMVLKDSFVGNCKTVMIGNISPAAANSEYTLNTLRYADRVKELKKDAKDRPKVKGDELMLARGNNTNKTDLKVEKNLGIISTKFDQMDDVPDKKNAKQLFRRKEELPAQNNQKPDLKQVSKLDKRPAWNDNNSINDEDELNSDKIEDDNYTTTQNNRNQKVNPVDSKNAPANNKNGKLPPKNHNNAENPNQYNKKNDDQSHQIGNGPVPKKPQRTYRGNRIEEETLETVQEEHEKIMNHLVKQEDTLLRKHTGHVRMLTNLNEIV